MIDLRSDTVTKPTEGMRKAMSEAVVGDDVLGDDPTVIELQNKVASMLGKEGGLFVPSGTMSNIIATRTHTSPGDEIITEYKSHIYKYEGGAFAALSGCSVALVHGKDGLMNPEDVSNAIRKSEGSLSHYPNGSLVCVENTAQGGGGTVYSQDSLDEICKIAKQKDCKLHLDGARLFHASTASGTPLSRMVRDFDTVSICLSKGLGSPVGSVLVGSKKTLEQAHRWRKMFGGGMRQAGIIAAAGLSQNLGALRALSTNGIQAGHMKLHARNMAVSAGAIGEEIETVAARLQQADGPKTQTLVGELLEQLRNE